MPIPLEEWHERLERHFESLAQARVGSGFPIFALEHGLTNEELEAISSLLRSRLEFGLSLSPHWLLWVVYSTERGYSYTGDEYWQSFEEQTPGWNFPDRYRVVPWFRKFQKAYDGVIPSGPWATQFKIIAWPITHAILPRYLQRQFARALYDLRFRLAALDTLRPAAVGRLLASSAYHTSNRFDEFLQQEELTGRIVLGLIGRNPAEGREPIYPQTLRRIVDDLDRVRNAREWLEETQRIVTDRFLGIGRGSGPPGERKLPVPDGSEPADKEHFSVQPSLLLRYAGAATWSVVMEVPSFRSVAALNPDIRAYLQRTRCRLSGATDMKSAGWLLSTNRKAVLKSWPDSRHPLIQFEQSHGTVDHLLETDCRLTSGPVWLFRIASDGTAREITSRIVRPGHDYIVLTTRGLPDARSFMSACSIQCTGIRAFRIQVRLSVSAQDIAWLQGLSIQVARTIRVWPAGLPGRGWDGEGNGEWLTTESPCFGIVHDHPVDAYVLSLNHAFETVIEAGRVGNPVFVRLAPLPAGTHTLIVKARRDAVLDSIVPSPPAEGFVQLSVREPEPWVPGVLSHPGLIVTLDPHDANLDIFWRNEAKVSVLGPESHTVTFTVSLADRDGHQIFSEQVGGAMNLPVTSPTWRQRFAQFVRREDCAWSYLGAARGHLIIKGEELGECSFQFEHDLLPLRWVLRRDHHKIILRLIDDTGEEGSEPKVLFYSMEHPLNMQSCSPQEALSGLVVVQPGGLYIARHGDHSDSIIVSAGFTADGLRGLGVRPECADLRNGSVTLMDSLHVLKLWHDARLSGFLPDIRRQHVLDGLLSAIYEIICGSTWARLEAQFRQDSNSQQAIDILQRAVDKHAGFAAVLRRDYANVCDNFDEALHWYADVATRYGICTERKVCEFALRLASQPQHLSQIPEAELGAVLNQLRTNPSILRGARMLALLFANQYRTAPALPSSP